ncbi:hypothetical protein CALVIDRAFT_603638 [Calocera viscosa TUFC12733]|uniref:Uncharacterized protein n=1 Tax=Calocera viscosa (strain TUFC12733) TaxID=1330018 RepID=A0A167FD14_CALVF|nr:hypothetical protein CALVIDRAFT_603638 [Calocera viscosa TUFC12733]
MRGKCLATDTLLSVLLRATASRPLSFLSRHPSKGPCCSSRCALSNLVSCTVIDVLSTLSLRLVTLDLFSPVLFSAPPIGQLYRNKMSISLSFCKWCSGLMTSSLGTHQATTITAASRPEDTLPSIPRATFAGC